MRPPSDRDKLERLRKEIVDSFMAGDKDLYARSCQEAHEILDRVMGPRIAEVKQHRVDALRKRNEVVVTCPHCHCRGGYAIMRRWHFDRCKRRVVRDDLP